MVYGAAVMKNRKECDVTYLYLESECNDKEE
jgi:hypothetical protein